MSTQRWKDGHGAIEARFPVELRKSIPVLLSDGIRLSTDLYLPSAPDLPKRLPVILIRTPYNKRTWRDPSSHAFLFASQGYAVVVQDHRGRYESEGEFFPYTAVDRHDGFDTLSWIIEQSWADERVGTYGCSYLGEVQAELAAMRHPNHACAILQGAAPHDGPHKALRGFGFLRYGVLELIAGFQWCRAFGTKTYYGPPSLRDRFEFFQSADADLFRVEPQHRDDPGLREVLSQLPLAEALQQANSHPSDFALWASLEPSDRYWQAQGTVSEQDSFDVPTLHMGSWYDVAPTVTLSLFSLFRDNARSERGRDNQYLIMAPTTHCRFEDVSEQTLVGKRPVGDARFNYLHTYIAWFDYWLKQIDNETEFAPKVRFYRMGRNEWDSADTWPPPGTVTRRFYLASQTGANSLCGDGVLLSKQPHDAGTDTFIYDPRNPVPSVAGPIFAAGNTMIEGSADQREVEKRHDVLIYTSPTLDAALDVCGAVLVTLWISSTAIDTDFTAKLVDVYPDGEAFNITEGVIRARYRGGLDQARWLQPGKRYRVEVDLEATCNCFETGHRLRLEVASSNFPRWARNTNSGGNNFDDPQIVIATNNIHFGADCSSYLQLSVRER
jgi:uncharacterized protein